MLLEDIFNGMAFFINVGYFGRFCAPLNTFSKKWRLFLNVFYKNVEAF
jgi:hypothetical protein